MITGPGLARRLLESAAQISWRHVGQLPHRHPACITAGPPGNAFVTLIAATLATFGVLLVQHQHRLAFAFRLRWLRRMAPVPGAVAVDALRLARPLVQPNDPRWGRLHVRAFEAGGGDPYSRGRRAALIAAVCLPPNTFVTDADVRLRVLTVHKLVPEQKRVSATRIDPAWPLS